jgi:manganese efflux pump family protein
LDLLTLIIIAFGLSFDSFAVSVCSGLSLCKKHIRIKDTLKIAGTLAFFQALMPLIGWFLGSTVKDLIEDYDHWIAFGLLSILGIKMIIESRKSSVSKIKKPTQWRVLIPMSLATSIDALAVGITFAFLVHNMVIPIIVIGLVTFGVSLSGLYMGQQMGARMATKTEIFGGIILISIGIKILIEHLFFASA